MRFVIAQGGETVLRAFGGGTNLNASCGGTIKIWFPLVGAAQSRVSDSPLPAGMRGHVCLRQTLAHPRNTSIR
jgi:hypothetical protein